MSTYEIRFFAFDSATLTDKLTFYKFRQTWTVTQLIDEEDEVIAHNTDHEVIFQDAEGTYKIYKIVFQNEYDFRLAEKIAQALQNDQTQHFAFVPEGIKPEIEEEFEGHP